MPPLETRLTAGDRTRWEAKSGLFCDRAHVPVARYRRPRDRLLEESRAGQFLPRRLLVTPSPTLQSLPIKGGLCPLCSCLTLELTVHHEEHWTAYTYVCHGCKGARLELR